MDYGYISSTQASIWFQDIWIDDACMIEYVENNPKEVFFGYNSTRYDAVALGRSIVSGSLAINYRYSGYLTKAILRTALSTSYDTMQELVKEYIQVASGKDAAIDEFVDLLAKAEKAGQLDDLQSNMEEAVWGDSKPSAKTINDLTNRIYGNISMPEIWKALPSIDIYVHLGPDNNDIDNENLEVIKDVQFTSMGRRIDNTSAEFGGMPIRESYNFIAKSVQPLS